MRIKVGAFYTNKTRKYLLPAISGHGEEVIKKLDSVFKLGIGVNDAIAPASLNLNNHIFILVDANVRTSIFTSVLDWLREQVFFELDYAYDDIVEGYQHMIVLKLPDNHKETYEYFINDKFSKMYSKDSIEKYFKKNETRFKILVKDTVMLKSFVDKINKDYNTSFRYEEWDGEIEYPLKKQEEIFNYNLVSNDRRKKQREGIPS